MKKNQIINADCFKAMQTFEDNSFNIALTSPPYNRKRNDKYQNYTDIVEDYYNWQVKIINELLRVTSRHVFYNIQTNYYNRSDVYKLIGNYSKDIREIIVWEKTNPMPAQGSSITNSVEYFLILGKQTLKSNKTYTKNIISTSVNSKMPKEHKAVMKQEVADYIIQMFAQPNDIVLDPLAGIGTTGIAAIKHNLKYVLIEKQPEYCAMAKKRLSQQKLL